MRSRCGARVVEAIPRPACRRSDRRDFGPRCFGHRSRATVATVGLPSISIACRRHVSIELVVAACTCFSSISSGMRCSAGRIAAGVDVRATGGYVIWWPAAGLPVLSDMPLAAWPGWLCARLMSRPRPKIRRIIVPGSIRAEAFGAVDRRRPRGRAERSDILGRMPRRRNGRLGTAGAPMSQRQ